MTPGAGTVSTGSSTSNSSTTDGQSVQRLMLHGNGPTRPSGRISLVARWRCGIGRVPGYASRIRKIDHNKWPEVTYNTDELDLSFTLKQTRFWLQEGLWQYVWRPNIWGCPEQHFQLDFGDGILLISEDDLSSVEIHTILL